MIRQCVFIFTGVFACLCIAATAAAETPANWQQSAQPLGSALQQLAAQSGISIVFDAKTVRGVQAPPLKGDFTPREALDQLLAGSGLQAKEIAPKRYSVVKAPATINADEPAKLPEITVTGVEDPDSPYSTRYNVPSATTATKTNTPIMQTPMGIQVVPKSVLNDQQAITLEQSLNNVSGVFSEQETSAPIEAYNIRGFRTFDYYREGVRFQSLFTNTGPREIANLERIEVLKGPASILFGRMEPGGMVNLVTKKPQATPYYSLQQQFGSYNTFRTTLDAAGGLNQDGSLMYRLNFAYKDAVSFRQFVDNNHFFLAPVLQWRISDRTQVTVEMEYKTGKSSWDYGIPAIGNRPAKLPLHRNLGESYSGSEFEEIVAGFNWSHAFNDQWEIKHRSYLQFTDADMDAVIPLGLQANNRTLDRLYIGTRNSKNDTYTTSLDLTGRVDTWGIKHTLLIGGDYYNYTRNALRVVNSSFPSIDIFNPIYGTPALFDSSRATKNMAKEEWFGLYLQDQMELPFNIHLLAGLRYTNRE